MDRNSAIGFTLIALLLMVYFYFFAGSPTPAPGPVPGLKPDSAQVAEKKGPPPAAQTAAVPGRLTGGAETLTEVENADLRMVFSNRGMPVEAELKNYKSYTQQPLTLISQKGSAMSLTARLNNAPVDLYAMFYEVQKSRKGDSTVITFTASPEEGLFVRHTYTLPPAGFEVRYRLESNALTTGETLTLHWTDQTPLVEKDLSDSRAKTTINFYTPSGGFDGLSETSTDIEEETVAQPVAWMAIRQKFFVSAIVADNNFAGGYVRTNGYPGSDQIVKEAEVKAFIPAADVAAGKAGFRYYFGPNEFSTLRQTGIPEFERNLYLGWPPVKWVNRYLVVPVFSFLERFITNYGLIIVVLVILIKLLLAPLSYQSYLGMAKMRVLKPELDLIKEKYGDNMAQIQQEQMKLYQQVGVNPFSGCIPVLLQMPILIAMFYFFPVSIEFRQQSFLWAEDLSTYDSVINLPFSIPFYGAHVSLFTILMTASTLVYTWQNNQISSITGPMRQISYIMPVVFMFVMNTFSAGLSFYYFVSNLVTFAQQAIIKRFVDEDKIKRVMDEHRKKMLANGGTGKKSKFMAKLEEAMKASQEAKKQAEKKTEKKKG
jgi:YidC/Oxa1 family membrane protein insertase